MRYIEHASRVLCLAVIVAFVLGAVMPAMVSAAPVTTLSISDPKYGTNPTYVNAMTEFTLSAVDSAFQPVSNIWFSWGPGNWTHYTGPFTATVVMQSPGGAPGLPIDLEGLQTLYYNATDSLGQNENAKSVQVFVDNTYPATQVQYNGAQYAGARMYITQLTVLSLTAVDTDSGLQEIKYRIDTEPETDYTGPFTVPPPGVHSLKYHALDNLDNSEPESTLNLFVDTEAPSVQILPADPYISSGGQNFASGSTHFTIEVEDDAGAAETRYMVDSDAWATYDSPFTVHRPGSHTITAMATDNLGHSSAAVTLDFVMDVTPPTVSINGSASTTIELAKGGSITFNISDSGVGLAKIYYTTDNGTTWILYSDPIIIAEDTTLSYYAEDGLRNKGDETTAYIVVVSQGIPMFLYALWIVIGSIILVAIYITYRRLDHREKEQEKDENEKKVSKKARKKEDKDDVEEQTRKVKMKRNR